MAASQSNGAGDASQSDRRVVAAGRVQPGGGIGMSGVIRKGKR